MIIIASGYCIRFGEYLPSKKPDDFIFIRYVGCTSASTPLKRQRDDNTRKNEKRRYNNLYRVSEKYGLVHQVVYSYPLLQVEDQFGLFDGPNRQLIDETEQVLIHLFGRDMLMNSQPGGFYYQYSSSHEPRKSISNINLDHAHEYLTESATPPIRPECHQEQIAMIYQNYRNELIEQGEPVFKEATDSYIQFLSEAAIPKMDRLIHGEYVPLTVLGDTISGEAFRLKRNFFEGCCAGAAPLTLLHHILGVKSFSGISFLDLRVINYAHNDFQSLHISTAGAVLKSLRPLTMHN